MRYYLQKDKTLTPAAPELLYQDTSLLVANKPAGLLSVPGRGADKQDCLAARVQQQFPDALVVHRLDMATSGLILFARGVAMQRQLSILFASRHIAKKYVAVVQGVLPDDAGEIDLPIAADWPNRPKQRVDHEHGKHSLTRYRVINREAGFTRVELEPLTGRTHQLRLHLASIGFPILGDALYGDVASAERLLLHACELSFVHPASDAPLNFLCPPPF